MLGSTHHTVRLLDARVRHKILVDCRIVCRRDLPQRRKDLAWFACLSHFDSIFPAINLFGDAGAVGGLFLKSAIMLMVLDCTMEGVSVKRADRFQISASLDPVLVGQCILFPLFFLRYLDEWRVSSRHDTTHPINEASCDFEFRIRVIWEGGSLQVGSDCD
jgi:hypothetical protein